MFQNAPSTLLAPLWWIFKAFPDLKPDCDATPQRKSVKYFTVTTWQPRSSAWSQICLSFPAQMELFRRQSCHQGFGASHFRFYGSCQTAPRRLFHGIPEASLNCQGNVSAFTANIMCHLHSEWCFVVFLALLLFARFTTANLAGCGQSGNFFPPCWKRSSLFIKQGCAALCLTFSFLHLYLPLPPDTPFVVFRFRHGSNQSHLRFKLNLSGSLLREE